MKAADILTDFPKPSLLADVMNTEISCTVVPAKRDSDVMFCLKVVRDLKSIDHLCIYPIHRIGLIHK